MHRERGSSFFELPGNKKAVCSIGLALVASVMLFLCEDPKLLRLDVVVALWAFVFGVGVTQLHRTVPVQSNQKELALQQMYEMELEREIAARRDFEMGLEVQLRRELENGLRSDVDELRRDISTMWQILETWMVTADRGPLRATSVRLKAATPEPQPAEMVQSDCDFSTVHNGSLSSGRHDSTNGSSVGVTALLAVEETTDHNGKTPRARRRRYREDHEDNDVLDRILNR